MKVTVTYIVHPRTEEGQGRFQPLSSNTGSTQGWREKATFKKEYVINEAFTDSFLRAPGGDVSSTLGLGSGMWNQSILLP